jgi:hypothetical protein
VHETPLPPQKKLVMTYRTLEDARAIDGFVFMWEGRGGRGAQTPSSHIVPLAIEKQWQTRPLGYPED